MNIPIRVLLNILGILMRLSEALDEAILDGFEYCWLPGDQMLSASIHTIRRIIRHHGYFVLEQTSWKYDHEECIIVNCRNKARLILFKDNNTIVNIRTAKYGSCVLANA
jgi:hypothetical protein